MYWDKNGTHRCTTLFVTYMHTLLTLCCESCHFFCSHFHKINSTPVSKEPLLLLDLKGSCAVIQLSYYKTIGWKLNGLLLELSGNWLNCYSVHVFSEIHWTECLSINMEAERGCGSGEITILCPVSKNIFKVQKQMQAVFPHSYIRGS